MYYKESSKKLFNKFLIHKRGMVTKMELTTADYQNRQIKVPCMIYVQKLYSIAELFVIIVYEFC